MSRRRWPFRSWIWNVVRVIDIWFQVERRDHRLGLTNTAFGPIDRLGDL